jgi:hypothetical protein
MSVGRWVCVLVFVCVCSALGLLAPLTVVRHMRLHAGKARKRTVEIRRRVHNITTAERARHRQIKRTRYSSPGVNCILVHLLGGCAGLREAQSRRVLRCLLLLPLLRCVGVAVRAAL